MKPYLQPPHPTGNSLETFPPGPEVSRRLRLPDFMTVDK
jgi:hypothetical protein